jgi:hypothetical protein
VANKFDYLQNFIGDKEFALGYLTLVDFHIAEQSYYFEALYAKEFLKYSFLGKIRRNFNHLPEIKAYYAR